MRIRLNGYPLIRFFSVCTQSTLLHYTDAIGVSSKGIQRVSRIFKLSLQRIYLLHDQRMID